MSYSVRSRHVVIAGKTPVDLLAADRMRIYKVKSFENHIIGHFMENIVSKW